MTLMSSHHIDFVTFDLPFQNDRRGPIDDPLTELLNHRPGVILVDVEFLGDLQSREVQPHQIQAGDPGSQGKVMAGEDGVGEVVEALATLATLVALAERLGVVSAVLDDRVGRASRASDAVGPADIPDGVETLGVVEEILDIDHRATPQDRNQR
jgi:hypothetical protein